MTTPTSFIPVKHRVRRKRRADDSSSTPPPLALGLTAVANPVFDGTDGACDLVFNTSAGEPLASVVGADAGKWTVRFDGVLYLGQDLSNVSFDTLHLVLQVVDAEAGADVVNYTNAPSDVSDALARQLGAFAGFPV